MFQSFYFHRPWSRKARVASIPVLLFCLAFLVLGGRLNGQVQTGINGTVVDSSGAVIPGATVTVRDAATGVVKQGTTTSTAGTFVVIGLIPGHYSVTVGATGFKTSVKTNVTVEISKVSAVTFKMVPGATSQTVHVAGNEISLNTTAPEIGATLEPELIATIPVEVNGGPRQPDAFVLQMPGVTLPQNRQPLIAGGELEMSSYYMNGIPIAAAGDQNIQSTAPPPYELIKEFRVDTSTFSAQYGLSQGAVTYDTASGTNQFHGDAFEILRNSLFDSAGFFPTSFNAAKKPIPPINHQNDYGFTVGGPVLIPKLYDGRDRTFFLFSLDRYKQNQAQTAIGTVPTAAMKIGDFSNFVDSTGKQIPIYDPTTGQQFAGNKINPTRFSALSKSVLPFIPDPDRTGTNFGLSNNKQPAVPSLPKNVNTWGYTIDENLNKLQSINYAQWHYYSKQASLNAPGIVPATNEIQSGLSTIDDGDGYLVNYVNTLTPNLVATAGVGWVGFTTNNAAVKPPSNTFAGVINPAGYFPAITFADFTNLSLWGQGTTGTSTVYDREYGFTVVNNWLWSKGRHTLNIGGAYYRNAQDGLKCAGCTGVFRFSQAETSTPDSTNKNFSKYGSAFASFLLGDVDSGTRTFAIELRDRSTDLSPYIQDNIKVNDRLTVNAGIRWDIMIPFNETSNNIVFANLTTLNSAANNLSGAATKYGHCVGCAGADRADMHWKNFGPRLGFSYMVNDKTVIQGGYFIAFLPGGAYGAGNGRVIQSYGNLLAGVYSRNSTHSNVPGYGNWDANPMPDPPATPFSPTIANGQDINILDPKKAGTAPYTQSWNVSLQRQLPWDQFLTVAYIGSRSVHLESGLNQPNQLNPAFLRYGKLLSQLVTSPAAVAAGIQIPYSGFVHDFGSNATVLQALVPYPQFASVSNPFDQSGSSLYNSLEVQGEKRFRNGLSYMASLVMARNMTSADQSISAKENAPVNTYDQGLEWSPSGYDLKYQTKFLVTYALPFGYGQKYLNSKRLLAQIAGGWQIAGIFNYWGGLPFGVTDSLGVIGAGRANTVPGQERTTYNYGRSKDYFTGKTTTHPIQFNTSAFALQPSYTLGNSKRTYASLREPPLRIEDIDVIKNFHITDRVSAILRMDYFNAFNRTQLEPPDANASHATFGQITSEGSQTGNRQGQAMFRIEF